MSTGLPLYGRTAVVTGAGRGIGRVVALQLARAGADVGVIDIDLTSFKAYAAEAELMTSGSTVEEIAALGRRTAGAEADLTDAAATADAVAEIGVELGGIDIGVCIAGGGIGSFEETAASIVDPEVFGRVIDRNLMATMHTCRALAPGMVHQGSGRLITMSSLLGHQSEPNGGYAHYGAAKAAIISYTRYLARDLGRHGITVNCLAPGYIRTGRLDGVFQAEGADELLSGVPLRRFGTAEECASVVEFLAGDGATYVSGAVIPIDGGAHA